MKLLKKIFRCFKSENVKTNNVEFNLRSEEPAGTYSYSEALELTGHGWYNHLVLLTVCMINLGAGMDMFCFGIVVAMAGCDLGIGHTETGLLVSAPFVGMVFAYPWGYFSDTKGRKIALLMSTLIGYTVSGLSCLSSSWQALLTFKIIGNSFCSASYTLTSTYLGENVGNLHRVQYLSIMTSINLGAELIGFGIAYLLQTWDFDIPVSWLALRWRPWRLLIIVMAIIPIIGSILIYFLPESPKFLASRGNTEEALKIMKTIFEKNGGQKENYPVKRLIPIDVDRSSFWKSLILHGVPIFQRPVLWRTLQLFFLIIVCATTGNTFIMWFSDLANSYFQASSDTEINKMKFCERIVSHISTNTKKVICSDRVSVNTIYLGMGLGAYMMAVGLVTSALAAWRRPTLLGLLVISAVSLLLVNSFVQPTVNMLAFVLFQLTGSGMGIIQSYFVDVYPTSHRGVAGALAMMVARLMSMAAVNLVGSVIMHHCAMTFYYWSIFVICGIAVAFFLPKDISCATVNKG